MKVNFYATLRTIIGQKTVDFQESQGITVQALIDQVLTEYPDLGAEILDEHGELLSYIHILINGRDVEYLEQGMDTQLTSKDRIDIFPPVGGGSKEIEEYETIFRAIPAWLLQEYLVELGGKVVEDGLVRGSGWEAKFKRIEDHKLGSIRVGQVHLLLKAAPDILEWLVVQVEKKTMRAGA